MSYDHHPCFSAEARHRVGRIHLPVAPKCNMQCNYCRRDFDCLNESRPGVTSTILTPLAAADYLDAVLERIGNIEVVGIAGPGDPFANGAETIETLRLVAERHPETMLCAATNGLEVSPYVDELARLGISHVTVTVNAVDPSVGAEIYAWARPGKQIYRGMDAAKAILGRQTDAIKRLKEKGITVKINTVVIPGINDLHVEEVARHVAQLGADIQNCVPLYHVAGTVLESIRPPSQEAMKEVREKAAPYMPQMSHCSRCRADAAGMVGEAQREEIQELLRKAARPGPTPERPFVAVASMEGLFVNQHVGEAKDLWIYGMKDGEIGLLERRTAPAPGGGEARWAELAATLTDCTVLLASGVGPFPQYVLERAGIRVVVMEGLAMEAIEAIFTEREIPKILLRAPGRCNINKQCRGGGAGCA